MNLTEEEVASVKAIIKAFYGERLAGRYHAGSITDETLELTAQLVTGTEICSKWIDAVPNPKDLLTPTSNIQKWAIRVIRAAGEPFVRGSIEINFTCKVTRGLQFRSLIEASLR